MQILIVEDSPLVQQMYGLAFPRREHELTAANDGREALTLLADPARHFDVVLLDLQMPGMNGVEFLREVRGDARLAQLPIVLTTIEPEESELLTEARRLGVTGVVKKPWHPHQLRDLVEAIIHRSE
jgi:CheY-like chemotaxis protein